MASQNGPAAWPSGDDALFYTSIVIVVGLAFFGWLSWTSYHAQIAWVVTYLAHWEIGLVHPFSNGLDGVDRTIASADLYSVTPSQILELLNIVGTFLRLPVIGVILILALLCFARAAPSRFTRKLDLDALMMEHAAVYKWTAPFSRLKLKLVRLEANTLRPLDPALHPKEWAKRFALDPNDAFDADAAAKAFALQLGPVWQGLDVASGHVRVLAAAFALHHVQRRKDAVDLLAFFGESMAIGADHDAAGPATFGEVPIQVIMAADAALNDDPVRQAVEFAATRHSYTATGLMTLLTEARRHSGVLAPAQFLSLKLIDRSLWYALHSLGAEGEGSGQSIHPNPVVEAAGARDHWEAERTAGRPLILPSVANAVSAIRAVVSQSQNLDV